MYDTCEAGVKGGDGTFYGHFSMMTDTPPEYGMNDMMYIKTYVESTKCDFNAWEPDSDEYNSFEYGTVLNGLNDDTFSQMRAEIKKNNIDICGLNYENRNSPERGIANWYFQEISMAELKYEIKTGHFWNLFRIVKSAPDGHCLIHSITTSLRVQHKRAVDNDIILKSIQTETHSNIEKYKGFLEEYQKLKLIKHMKDYIYLKKYNTIFGDQVPLIIANALQLDIIIIEARENSWYPRIIAGPQGCSKTRVYIYKCREHYDGIGFTERMVGLEPPGSRIYFCKNDPQNTLVIECGNSNLPTSTNRAISQSPQDTGYQNNDETSANLLRICFWNIRGLYQYKLCKNICGSFLARYDVILLVQQ